MLRRPLRYAGVEAVFASEQVPIASKAYVESMHEKNLIVWANAIVYNYRDVLAAGHNDDISVSGRPDEGWGWLLVQGYDIIQTDWPLMLSQYMYKNEHHDKACLKLNTKAEGMSRNHSIQRVKRHVIDLGGKKQWNGMHYYKLLKIR